MIRSKFLIVAVLILLLTAGLVVGEDSQDKRAAAVRTGEQIARQVISSGGTEGSSTSYAVKGTVCQIAVGTGSSSSYALSHGFWTEEPSAGTCCQIRGDINHDGGGPDISDLVYLVTYMFQQGPPPPCTSLVEYYDEADVNGSFSGPDIADLVYLVTYMFQSGPAPVACP